MLFRTPCSGAFPGLISAAFRGIASSGSFLRSDAGDVRLPVAEHEVDPDRAAGAHYAPFAFFRQDVRAVDLVE